MIYRNIFAIAMLCVLVVSANAQQPLTITGAGATFPVPLYHRWSQESRTSVNFEINYQSIGSGAGQNQIRARTVDFGASDAPMSRLDENNLVQVPTVMGAVVPIINIPGIATNQLRLSGITLTKIFLGQIQMWNHPDIVAENPTLTLPRLAIAPVYRGDGSGTTFVFSGYLASQNSEWNSKVGIGTSLRWPVGTGARGNEGVSGTVRQVRGSIGYVESAFAKVNNIPMVVLRNRDGNWVEANNITFTAAAENAAWSQDTGFVVDLLNQPGAQSWPIISATYIIVPRNGVNRMQVLDWITWAYANGGTITTSLDYIPLPTNAQTLILEYLKTELTRTP